MKKIKAEIFDIILDDLVTFGLIAVTGVIFCVSVPAVIIWEWWDGDGDTKSEIIVGL